VLCSLYFDVRCELVLADLCNTFDSRFNNHNHRTLFLHNLAYYFQLYYMHLLPLRYYNCSHAVTSIILPHWNAWMGYLIMNHSLTDKASGLEAKECNLHSVLDGMRLGGNGSNTERLRSGNCNRRRTIYLLFHAFLRFVSFDGQIHSIWDMYI
jgi:hypothetical protein